MKKKILIALVVVLLIFALAAGTGIMIFNARYISPRDAVQLALNESAVGGQNLREVDCDFEWSPYSAWYEIDINIHGFEYEYSIDAVTGEILHSSLKSD